MNKEERLIEWGKSRRKPRIENTICELCNEEGKCLVFKDNEGYSTEDTCIECLKLAIELATK